MALTLSAADRRWIDFLSQTVSDTWDDSDPSRPKTMGYLGSEEFIRLQFEEYLLALLSSIKYHDYLQKPGSKPAISVEGDPIGDFGHEWVSSWQSTSSFALFNETTDSHLFDIVEPRHPTAGNLSFDDIQRRLTMQIQTLHLEERLASSKETLNKHLTTGHEKVSTAISNLWSDFENMREARRERAEMASHGLHSKSNNRGSSSAPTDKATSNGSASRLTPQAPDMATAQASLSAAGQKAGAYMSSWGSWASEKRKDWAKPAQNTNAETAGMSKDTPSQSRLSRWASTASLKISGPGLKEEKGGDGIGRLDA